jgi:hypothetical protein
MGDAVAEDSCLECEIWIEDDGIFLSGVKFRGGHCRWIEVL